MGASENIESTAPTAPMSSLLLHPSKVVYFQVGSHALTFSWPCWLGVTLRYRLVTLSCISNPAAPAWRITLLRILLEPVMSAPSRHPNSSGSFCHASRCL